MKTLPGDFRTRLDESMTRACRDIQAEIAELNAPNPALAQRITELDANPAPRATETLIERTQGGLTWWTHLK